MISIWEKETFFAPQDVVITGSGFVGLWSAWYLKRKHPKLNITILERSLIPTGASTRNAGFACFGSLSEVVHDARQMGNEKMLELVEMRFKGLERIQKHFSRGIDFDMCGGYELYEQGKVPEEELNHNISYINSLVKSITGSKNTYRLNDENIESFGFEKTVHLVKNNLEGCLHSGKLVKALLHEVQGMGVQVWNQVELKSYHRAKNGLDLDLQTPSGKISLHSKQLLLCTNAFTRQIIPGADIVPARGQVLLTSPIENLPWKGTFHSDEGFYYFRNLGNRVLLGGARNRAFREEETTEMNISEPIQQALEQYLDTVILPRFKGRYEIEMRWSGIMAMGSEKLPILQEMEPGVFCAVRMSGMGVALAPVVARQVTRMMQGS